MSTADAIIAADAINSMRPGSLGDYLATLPESERETAANAVRAARQHREDAAELAREIAATRAMVRNLDAASPRAAGLYVLELNVAPHAAADCGASREGQGRVAACAAAALDELDQIRTEKEACR